MNAIELAEIMDAKARGERNPSGDPWGDFWCAEAARLLREMHEALDGARQVLAKPSVEERLVAKVGSERAYELAVSNKSLEELAAIADAPEPEQSNEA